MLNSLCVIPARCGSKGLKNKNILDLGGKPVLAYSIEACKASGIFGEVYVATDNEDYANIAERYGAKVPFLEPESMAGDYVSSTEPVIYFNDMLNENYDLLWCVQPTSPMKIADDIVAAYKVLEQNEQCDFVLSTTEVDPHYFHWALEDKENGISDLFFGKKMLVDRSQLNKVYRPNGAIKVGRKDKVVQYRHYFGENIMRMEMPEERSIHIRSKFDLDLCRFLIAQRG